jgi:hypothetical protein
MCSLKRLCPYWGYELGPWTSTDLPVKTVMPLAQHTLVAGLLARSQYSEGPATGHLGTGFSWFPGAYKRMLR